MLSDGIGLASRAGRRQAFLGHIHFVDTSRNPQAIFIGTACSQTGPQLHGGAACQKTPPTLPAHCHEASVWRYDVMGNPNHSMPKLYNILKSRESPMRIHFYENQVQFVFRGALYVPQTSESTAGGTYVLRSFGPIPPRRIADSLGVETMAKLHSCFGQVWLLL